MTADNMFPEGMPDMNVLLEQAQQMQEQVVAAQERLAHLEVEGSGSGGLVTAKVTGMGELIGLDIQPEAIDADDRETLADLVVAAVREATTRASALAAEELGPFTGMGDLSAGEPPASGGTLGF